MKYKNIDPEIQKTLFDRIDAINRNDNLITDHLFPRSDILKDAHVEAMLAKSCWARVHSSTTEFKPGENENEFEGKGTLFRLSSAFTGKGRNAQPLSSRESKSGISKTSDALNGRGTARALTSEPDMYNSDAQSRFRPHAGITGISTSFKGLTIVETKIDWVFWDIEQFEKYESALMKHGRYIMVEFGWTTPVISGSPRFENISKFLGSYTNIRKKIKDAGGNYFQTLGKIKNFNYSIGTSGQFICSTELYSGGSDIMGSKVESDPVKVNSTATYGEEKVGKALKKSSISFANYMKTLDEQIREDKSGRGTFYHASETYSAAEGSPPPPKPGYNKGWCSWGWFEDVVLNTFFGLHEKNPSQYISNDETNNPFLSFIRSGGFYEDDLCRSHSSIATLSKDIILPGKTKGLKALEESANNDELKTLSSLYNEIDRRFDPWEGPDGGIIRNFVFSAEYLQRSFSGEISSLKHAVNKFWSGVSGVYGGFWDFKLYQSTDNLARVGIGEVNKNSNNLVSDSTTKDPGKRSTRSNPNKNFRFSVYSNNSLLKDFDLNLDTSSDMATRAMFHSSKNFGEEGDLNEQQESLGIRALGSLGNTTMNGTLPKVNIPDIHLTTPISDNKVVVAKYNSLPFPYAVTAAKLQIKDVSEAASSIMKKILSDSNKQQQDAELKVRDKETLKEYGDGYYEFNTSEDGKTVTDLIYDIKGNVLEPFSRTIKAVMNGAMVDPKTDEATTEPLMPVKVSFSMNGIAGIEPMDLFTLDYLPTAYRDKTCFVVMSVSHNIGPTGWTTKIEANMVLATKTLYENAVGNLTKEQVKTFKKFKANQLTSLRDAVNRQDEETPKEKAFTKDDYIAKAQADFDAKRKSESAFSEMEGSDPDMVVELKKSGTG